MRDVCVSHRCRALAPCNRGARGALQRVSSPGPPPYSAHDKGAHTTRATRPRRQRAVRAMMRVSRVPNDPTAGCHDVTKVHSAGIQCTRGVTAGASNATVVTVRTISGRFARIPNDAQSRSMAAMPASPNIRVKPARIVSRSPQPCTHKSVGLIDVRLHPNSGAQADTSELRMWANKRHRRKSIRRWRWAPGDDDDLIHEAARGPGISRYPPR